MRTVKLVLDLGVSSDGHAEPLEALSNVHRATHRRHQPDRRAALGDQPGRGPAGLQPPGRATPIAMTSRSRPRRYQIQVLSLLFIIVLLLLAFRAVLAPLITLLPAAFVLVLSPAR